MSSRRSVLITGASIGTGAVWADSFSGRPCNVQGFLSASPLLSQAVTPISAALPSQSMLGRTLGLVHRAMDAGRAAVRGLSTAACEPTELERALAQFLQEVAPLEGIQFRFVMEGKPRALRPAIQEELVQIGREAVLNALRHSGATQIDVEVQYLRAHLRLCIHDNGCGIGSAMAPQRGLREMRERAQKIGARFGVWSRPGGGTEVVVALSASGAHSHIQAHR